MTSWTTMNIPKQNNRLAVVTGTGGIGFETALALSRAGAEVILAGRDRNKGEAAIARIQAEAPGTNARFEVLDLASLGSVAAFGARMRKAHDQLDLLINNAGVMTPPTRRETRDGFELQFGTNYLGHFALTAHLLPLLRRGTDARVVTLGSVAARQGEIKFDDLNAREGYRPMPVYSQSKLACVMFALELQNRSDAGGWGLSSFAAHPGISRTDLLMNTTGRWDASRLMRIALPFLFQPATQGALPVLYAATAREAEPGCYYGPDSLGETRGHPALARVPALAMDAAAAARLWDQSERLTGLSFYQPVAALPG